MYKKTCFRISLLIFVFTISCAAAQATVLRAYVSSTGNDANMGTNCTQAAPCRTFAAAFPVVTPGGELIALDSSGYGPIASINKSITIAAVPGAHAFIVVAAGTNGIFISNALTDSVTLRNLHFNGNGSANSRGVVFGFGGALHIEDCIFTGLEKGLYLLGPTSNTTVTDSVIKDGTNGIYLEPSDQGIDNPLRIAVEHCRFENYVSGFVAAGYHSVVSIRDSQFVGKGRTNAQPWRGIVSSVASAGTTHMMIENSLISNNNLGIGTTTDGVAFFSLSQNVIFANNTGVSTCCLSKMITFSNNRFEHNNDDGSFDLSHALK
jgi:hypothetical protein